VQIGGSARGYQEAVLPLAHLSSADQAGGGPYIYASLTLDVNARYCRGERVFGVCWQIVFGWQGARAAGGLKRGLALELPRA
jgi:hypothetical protein